MKTLMLTGAIVGFCLGLALGLAGQTQWPTALWHACAAAAALGLLMRWWGRFWVRSLQASIEQRHAEGRAQPRPNVSAQPAKK